MTNQNEIPRRASDVYIPAGLFVTLVSILAALYSLSQEFSQSIIAQENRLTKLELKLEEITELKTRTEKQEERIRVLEDQLNRLSR